MAYTTIDNPELNFQTKLHSGTGAENAITLDGSENMQPDWIWLKSRSQDKNHFVQDVVRGITYQLRPSATNAENNYSQYVKSVQSDGFTLGTDPDINNNGSTYVSWNWKAGGSASSNSNGGITSSVSANATAGFSIVSWTGNGSDATVGHGLSSAPQMYVVKNRSDSADWRVGQTVAGNTMTAGNGYYMEWNDDKASTNPGSAVTWGSTPTAPTSTVFTVGSNNAHNGSSDNMIAYCFHSVKGYQKIGVYTGNGSQDNGPFIYTGFRPAFVFTKRVDSTSSWGMLDNKRPGTNLTKLYVLTDRTQAEADDGSWGMDLFSNGWKARYNNGNFNASGGTYLYWAIANAPFVNSKGVPATARGSE